MGSDFYEGEDHPREFYPQIFEWLKQAKCDWIYAVPAIGVVKLGGREDDITESGDRSFEEAIEAINAEIEAEVYKTIPHTVRAYHKVYGKLPEGYRF